MFLRRRLHKNESSRKEHKAYYGITSLSTLAVPFTFLCVNGVAFAIDTNMAAVMLVPNIFILQQLDLVGPVLATGLSTCASAYMAVRDMELFFILAVHSLFYMAILLKNFTDKTKIHRRTKDSNSNT